MSGYSTRLRYDKCSYDQFLKQETDPLSLVTDIDKYVNKNFACRSGSDAPQRNTASIVDIESSLRGIDKVSSDCDQYKHPFCGPRGCLLTKDPRVAPHVTPWIYERGDVDDTSSVTKTNIRKPTGTVFKQTINKVCDGQSNGYYNNYANNNDMSLFSSVRDQIPAPVNKGTYGDKNRQVSAASNSYGSVYDYNNNNMIEHFGSVEGTSRQEIRNKVLSSFMESYMKKLKDSGTIRNYIVTLGKDAAQSKLSQLIHNKYMELSNNGTIDNIITKFKENAPQYIREYVQKNNMGPAPAPTPAPAPAPAPASAPAPAPTSLSNTSVYDGTDPNSDIYADTDSDIDVDTDINGDYDMTTMDTDVDIDPTMGYIDQYNTPADNLDYGFISQNGRNIVSACQAQNGNAGNGGNGSSYINKYRSNASSPVAPATNSNGMTISSFITSLKNSGRLSQDQINKLVALKNGLTVDQFKNVLSNLSSGQLDQLKNFVNNNIAAITSNPM
jgi:hypothetical protein